MSGRELTMVKALNEAHFEIMHERDDVICLGENVAAAGGSFGATVGLLEEFGPERVLDTPISEAGWVGLAIGAAMTGLRPIIDLMFNDFIALAMDQVVNQGAHMRYMTGGQLSVPLVIRCPMGGGRSLAAQHSQALHAWFAHIPGLKVVMPSTPHDAKGLLRTAVDDENIVLFFEHKVEYGRKGPVPQGRYTVPFGLAEVRRPGRDVTVVATSSMVYKALEAAQEVAEDGVEVEVVDPRTLVPLDMDTIGKSVARTGRAIVVDEGHRSYGAGAEIAASIADHAFDYLEEPIRRVGTADTPIPFNPHLERQAIPQASSIVAAVRELVR